MAKQILKRNGEVVPFEEGVLERSLRRAGASGDFARRIVGEIETDIRDGDSTGEIYKKAFHILYEREKRVAMQYSLKKALFSFGPTGFPFEKFIAEIYRRKGYAVTTNVHLRGKCVSHEVDVLTSAPEHIAMEVKFHNDMRIRSDVKTALYLKARFDDLTAPSGPFSLKKGAVDRCIFVTNTKFTRNAINYASCAGITLLGWGYPYRENLQTYIQEVDAHPITCLPSLKTATVKELFSRGIVTCRGLLEERQTLRALSIPDSIAVEAEMLCRPEGRR